MKSATDRIITMEMVRVTERAAVAAATLRGHGNKNDADGAAVDAMRSEMNTLSMRGRVVIGEGEMDEAPMLYIGEEIGTGQGAELDIAVDPLEGTNLCAKDMPGAIAVLALADRGTLLHAPDCYMNKIAIGPGYPEGIVDLDAPTEDNILALAKAKGVKPSGITAIILERPRHDHLVKACRKVGAGVRFITDGDVAAVVNTTDPEESGIDIYLGSGGAPEGVLAAAVLKCVGGQMQGRLQLDDDELLSRAAKMGITDPHKKYTISDMVRGEVLVAATGVTDGNLISGVRFRKNSIETESIVFRSSSGTVRRIKAVHRDLKRFGLA